MISRLLSVMALALFMAGCSMVPKYERPNAPISAAWPAGAAGATGQSTLAPASEMDWQEFFDDPRLQHLISLGLENNRDLRVAALRVEQTRAQYRIERSALYPTLDAGGVWARRRTPSTVSITGDDVTSSTYEVSGIASYEVDLFGRIRSLKQEALARYLASDEVRKSVQITLIAEIATQYLSLLELLEARTLAEQTLEAVRSSYDLNRRSFEAGASSELDLRTAQTQVETARVNVANYQQLVLQAENALVLLIGQPLPDDLPAGRSLYEQSLLNDLPLGIPSEVLQRRPDILAAEQMLKAANANIGAARAAFFPRILLTASAGTASVHLTDLFTGPSAAWSFSPQITVPIFNAGRNRANLDVSQLSKEIEIATYEKAIQSAFREVADALAVRSIVDERLEAQSLLVEAQSQRFTLTTARYRQGLDSYVDVLLAQQDLYTAQQRLLQFRAARLINAVTLYRSLGGGWKPVES